MSDVLCYTSFNSFLGGVKCLHNLEVLVKILILMRLAWIFWLVCFRCTYYIVYPWTRKPLGHREYVPLENRTYCSRRPTVSIFRNWLTIVRPMDQMVVPNNHSPWNLRFLGSH